MPRMLIEWVIILLSSSSWLSVWMNSQLALSSLARVKEETEFWRCNRILIGVVTPWRLERTLRFDFRGRRDRLCFTVRSGSGYLQGRRMIRSDRAYWEVGRAANNGDGIWKMWHFRDQARGSGRCDCQRGNNRGWQKKRYERMWGFISGRMCRWGVLVSHGTESWTAAISALHLSCLALMIPFSDAWKGRSPWSWFLLLQTAQVIRQCVAGSRIRVLQLWVGPECFRYYLKHPRYIPSLYALKPHFIGSCHTTHTNTAFATHSAKPIAQPRWPIHPAASSTALPSASSASSFYYSAASIPYSFYCSAASSSLIRSLMKLNNPRCPFSSLKPSDLETFPQIYSWPRRVVVAVGFWFFLFPHLFAQAQTVAGCHFIR